MSSKRRRFINVPSKVDNQDTYGIVGRLGIGDPVVLVVSDIEVTVKVEKLARVVK